MLTKVIVFLSVFCYVSTGTPTNGNSRKEDAKMCQKATGISDADAEELQRSEVINDESIVANRCFVACMLSKKGVMKNGTLNVDTLVQVSKQAFQEDGREFDEASFRKGVSDCNSTTGEGKCVKSYNTWKCFLEFSMKTIAKEDNVRSK